MTFKCITSTVTPWVKNNKKSETQNLIWNGVVTMLKESKYASRLLRIKKFPCLSDYEKFELYKKVDHLLKNADYIACCFTIITGIQNNTKVLKPNLSFSMCECRKHSFQGN